MAQSRFTCAPLWRLQKMKCATGRDFWANGAPYDLIKNPGADSKHCCINVWNLYLYRAYACIIYSYYTYHVIYNKIVHSVN